MPASLNGPLTSASVPGVLKGFVPAADGVVDLSGVTEYDSSALALLLELTRRAAAKGGKLRCVGAPTRLVELAGFFELEEALGLVDTGFIAAAEGGFGAVQGGEGAQ